VIILTRLAGIQKKLIEKACKAMNNAYVLWGFQVGAAVLAEDGRIYEGCDAMLQAGFLAWAPARKEMPLITLSCMVTERSKESPWS